MGIIFKYKVPAIFQIAGTFRIKSTEPTIYLTFDDGPNPEVTPFVLETLNQAQIKATFFLSGENVEKHPNLYNKIVAQQHQVGNHGYGHLKGWKTKNDEYFSDVDKAQKLINSKLFRPPYGKMKPSQYKILRQKYAIIYWTIMSFDFDNSESWQTSLKKITRFVNNGSIIVFHDTLKAQNKLINLLPQVIDFGLKNNYKFSKIDL